MASCPSRTTKSGLRIRLFSKAFWTRMTSSSRSSASRIVAPSFIFRGCNKARRMGCTGKWGGIPIGRSLVQRREVTRERPLCSITFSDDFQVLGQALRKASFETDLRRVSNGAEVIDYLAGENGFGDR